jgi:hypothetical protein
MTKAKILFKFATRSRPDKFITGINNIFSKVSDKENFQILVSADSNDTSMYNQEVMNKIKDHLDSGKIIMSFGESKSKIDAINRDMELVNDWHILMNFSDDMEFITDGFDEIVRSHFATHFPDYNGNMDYNDGYVGDKLSTMSIIGKTYFDTVLNKRIYNDEYMSLFCDNEYTEVAKKLNKIQYYNMILYKHNHPSNNGSMLDEQYRRTESYWEQDKLVYEKRSKINFGL